MNRHVAKCFLLLLTVALLSAGCVQKATEKPSEDVVRLARAEGDSTVYALTAAGSNDSILVFLELPYDGADPDTVNILEARRQRQMFGRPTVGDNVAIFRNDSNASLAERVIVIEQFVGTWCYRVYPRLRHQIGEGPLPPRLQEMLEESREYSMMVKPDGLMFVTGAHDRMADEQLPVVYPQAKNYGRWAIYNGRLLLSEVRRDTTDAVTTIDTDTADFIRMRRDTLILQFNDGERHFYRKTEEE